MSKYNIAIPANSIDWIANSLIMIDIWTVQDHILFDTKQYLNVTEITPQTFKVLSHIQYCYSIYVSTKICCVPSLVLMWGPKRQHTFFFRRNRENCINYPPPPVYLKQLWLKIWKSVLSNFSIWCMMLVCQCKKNLKYLGPFVQDRSWFLWLCLLGKKNRSHFIPFCKNG